MDFKVIWSPSARLDLKEIVSYIAEDNGEIAQRFGLSLIDSTKSLASFPEKGRSVPELGTPEIREEIIKPYRIIYRVKEAECVIEIVRVWHEKRGTPEA
jgi:toxin ParE1/3/4